MKNSSTEDKYTTCLRFASQVHGNAVRIYNIIREVGYGKLTADNALHQLVEDYHCLQQLGDEIGDFAKLFDE